MAVRIVVVSICLVGSNETFSCGHNVKEDTTLDIFFCLKDSDHLRLLIFFAGLIFTGGDGMMRRKKSLAGCSTLGLSSGLTEFGLVSTWN